MKKGMVLFAGALATLSLCGLAFAQTTTPATKEPTKETAAPAQKPAAHKIQARHLTAEVVSVNPEAKTLTVKRGAKGKELTFTVESGAAAHLGDLKAGDQVRVGYIHIHNQLMAKDIVKSNVAKVK
jgi:Cu/Ag efflux protein CusF